MSKWSNVVFYDDMRFTKVIKKEELTNFKYGQPRLSSAFIYTVQITSGNHKCGRVLNGELYAHRFQRLIHLHLFPELFHDNVSSIVKQSS